jgi:uncharacterized cofD-like protein
MGILRKYTLPGLKRWLIFILFGFFFIVFGIALILKTRPVTLISQFTWELLSFVADRVPPTVSGLTAVSLGIFLLIFALFRSNKQVLNLIAPDESSLLEALDRHHMAGKGIKIVAIGGGTGLSNMLKGLKVFTSNITAVVTVADDGGSSGRLRQSMNIVPPGDIRSCIAALAHDHEVITQLFQYRFDKDAPQDLQSHSFGNLFLTALVELGGTNNMADAVKQACTILKARGEVLPISNEPMYLIAEMLNGDIIEGESQIPKANNTIKRIFCKQPPPKILPEVLEAVANAEVIIFGPGSLYTSIIPNLLVPELSRAVAESRATKVYVCNVMTQPGETNNYTAADHLAAILNHVGEEYRHQLIDYMIVNDMPPRKKQLEKYKQDHQFPVATDNAAVKELEVEIYPANLLQKGDLVRHNPRKLAKAIMKLYSKDLERKSLNVKKLIKNT